MCCAAFKLVAFALSSWCSVLSPHPSFGQHCLMPLTVSGCAWHLRVACAGWGAGRHEVGCRLPMYLGRQQVQEHQTSAGEQRPSKTLHSHSSSTGMSQLWPQMKMHPSSYQRGILGTASVVSTGARCGVSWCVGQ